MGQVQNLICRAAVWFFGGYMMAQALYPHWATVSQFGAMSRTLVPYVMAMWGLAYCLWRASSGFAVGRLSFIAPVLRVVALLLVLVVFLPYNGGIVVFWTHMAVACLIFLLCMYVSIRAAISSRNIAVVLLTATQALMFGLLLSVQGMSESRPFIWQLHGQYELVFVACFLLLLGIVARELPDSPGYRAIG